MPSLYQISGIFWHICVVFTVIDILYICIYLLFIEVCTEWFTFSRHSMLLHILPQCGTQYLHYGDVTMSSMMFQITSLRIVYSTVYSSEDQRKHQSSASLAFVWGIHRGPVNSPHKWPVTRKMFPFDDVIMRSLYFLRISYKWPYLWVPDLGLYCTELVIPSSVIHTTLITIICT